LLFARKKKRNKMFNTLEERNLAIIETVMLELGVSDIEELPAKVIELNEEATQLRLQLTGLYCQLCGEPLIDHVVSEKGGHCQVK